MKTKTINKKLSALRTFLKSASFYKEAYILALAVSEGVVPDFAWLDKGFLISKMRDRAGTEAFDEFIELNSDKFAVWNPIKYLSSGMVGDAWELDDGRVLKIFDKKTNLRDYSKYKEIMDAQWEGRSNLNLPMVYELGNLEMPSQFYNVRAPSKKNPYGHPSFAYVILEKVETPKSIISDRLSFNPNLTDPYTGVKQKVRVLKLKEDEIPNSLRNEYYDSLADENYEYFLNRFVNYMLDNIIDQMHRSYEDYVDYLEEEDKENINDPEHREGLIDFMVQSVEWSKFYSEESLGALERELSLAKGWEEELAESVYNNINAGRYDLHSGNFGLRNGKFVFFDA